MSETGAIADPHGLGEPSPTGENQMSDPKDKPEKQESLPFPPTPSGSVAGRTMQELVYKPQPNRARFRPTRRTF